MFEFFSALAASAALLAYLADYDRTQRADAAHDLNADIGTAIVLNGEFQ